MNYKEVWVLKDVRFLGLENSLEIQWVKHVLNENDSLFKKANVRSSISLDKPDTLDAEKHLKEQLKNFGLDLALEQAKEIGRLNDVINAMSGEVRTHKKDKKEKDEKITKLETEKLKEEKAKKEKK